MAAQAPIAPASPPVRISSQFQKDLVALIPQLRAFSRALCGGKALADDMAQEALARAWRSRDSFAVGTNLKAWVFTILRNEFYSQARRSWRQIPWDAEKGENIASASKEQDWTAELSDTARALRMLPIGQREALILVGVGGFSYEDAAKMTDSPIGTVKSRVARARVSLQAILDGDEPLPDSQVRMAEVLDDLFAQLGALMPDSANGPARANDPGGKPRSRRDPARV
jgi:RNA polymerase sigma-70 factor (ECF subfamily)